jgi:hypothetical protein
VSSLVYLDLLCLRQQLLFKCQERHTKS